MGSQRFFWVISGFSFLQFLHFSFFFSQNNPFIPFFLLYFFFLFSSSSSLCSFLFLSSSTLSLPLLLCQHFLLNFSFLFFDLCFIYLFLSPVSSGIFSNSTSEIKELFISLTETTVYSQLLPSASSLVKNRQTHH